MAALSIPGDHLSSISSSYNYIVVLMCVYSLSFFYMSSSLCHICLIRGGEFGIQCPFGAIAKYLDVSNYHPIDGSFSAPYPSSGEWTDADTDTCKYCFTNFSASSQPSTSNGTSYATSTVFIYIKLSIFNLLLNNLCSLLLDTVLVHLSECTLSNYEHE